MATPSLLGLPNELLLAIAAFTIPEGIEYFALSCKALYLAAEPFLPEHNRLRKRYRSFAYPQRAWTYFRDTDAEPDKSDAICSSLDLLLSIADNPIVARYIEAADLRYDDDRDFDGADDGVLQALRGEGAERHKVLQLLRASSYLTDAQIDPSDFLDAIIKDPASLNLKAFLFTLLPNIRDLTPPRSWVRVYGPSEGYAKEDTMWSLLDVLVKRANNPDCREEAAFAKLEILRPIAEPEYDLRILLQGFTPFLSLPKLSDFYSASLLAFCDGYTGTRMLDTRYGTFGQALETVWMEGCCVDDGNIRKMLSSCPRIRDFRFGFQTKWHGCGHYTDMGHFVQAVEDTTYDRLENLTVYVDNCYGGTGTGTVSMKRFEKLKKLEIGLECFEGPPCGGEIDRGWDEEKAGETAHGENETPLLTEVLPTCLEELVILSQGQDEHRSILSKLFDGVCPESLAKSLPKLHTIVVDPAQGPNEQEDVEIVVSSGTEQISTDVESLWKTTQKAIRAVGGQIETATPRRPSWAITPRSMSRVEAT